MLYIFKTFKDLEKDLSKELGGNFRDATLALMLPPRVFDARELRKAIQVNALI